VLCKQFRKTLQFQHTPDTQTQHHTTESTTFVSWELVSQNYTEHAKSFFPEKSAISKKSIGWNDELRRIFYG